MYISKSWENHFIFPSLEKIILYLQVLCYILINDEVLQSFFSFVNLLFVFIGRYR